jgi:hypothetical protein
MAENVKVKNVKKVEYDGIKFDSALEVFTYKQLKLLGIEFKYAVEVFEILPALLIEKSIIIHPNDSGADTKSLKQRFKIQKKTYKPDFTLYWKNYFIVIENKGYGNFDWVSKRKLFIHYFENQWVDRWYKPVYLEAHTQRQALECIEFIKNLE